METKRRKPRSDRNHIIYMASLKDNPTAFYIGTAVMLRQAVNKTLKKRKDGHEGDTFKRNSQRTFHKAIREHGMQAFQWRVIEKVRGRKQAFRREAELINSLKAPLNDLKCK